MVLNADAMAYIAYDRPKRQTFINLIIRSEHGFQDTNHHRSGLP